LVQVENWRICDGEKGEEQYACHQRNGAAVVDTLRDTRCSGVVVRRKFVKEDEDQYTGKYCYILLIDYTVRLDPIVTVRSRLIPLI
jgi:hypothetical protein